MSQPGAELTADVMAYFSPLGWFSFAQPPALSATWRTGVGWD